MDADLMPQPRRGPWRGSVSYRKEPDEGEKFYEINVPPQAPGAPNLVFRVRVRKLTDVTARVSFVDADGDHMVWPRNVLLATAAATFGQIHPPFGDVVVIVWSESYVLMLDEQPIMKIFNQRQQAIFKSTGSELEVYEPHPQPPLPPVVVVQASVPIIPLPPPVLLDEDDDNPPASFHYAVARCVAAGR
jgi:hypothetical protein